MATLSLVLQAILLPIICLLVASDDATTADGSASATQLQHDNDSSSSSSKIDDERQCVLGACFVERHPANDHIVPKSVQRCKDLRSDCEERRDECHQRGTIIANECPKTCELCQGPWAFRTIDISPDNQHLLLQTIPQGSASKVKIVETVGADCGVLQMVNHNVVPATDDKNKKNDQQESISPHPLRTEIVAHAMRMDDYMKSLSPSDVTACRNQHEQCVYWAVVGECENNPGYMLFNCGPACLRCRPAAQ